MSESYFHAACSAKGHNTDRCPACGTKGDTVGSQWQICSLCGWEDDPVQFDNPNETMGANGFSLNEWKATLTDRINAWQAAMQKYEQTICPACNGPTSF